MRVAVIGTGVIGAAAGWHLSRRDVEVFFIDRAEPGAGVTDWTFSWVNASNKTQTEEYFQLSVAGLEEHYRLAATIGGGDWWHPTGHLRWTDTPEAAERLEAKVSQLASLGYEVQLWEAERARRLLEPAVRFPADDAPVAVYFREGWIDGRALVARLVDDAVERGARALFETAAADIVTEHGRVAAVVTTSGQRHLVDAVVNAAGPDGDKIAALVGRALPMRYDPGLIIRLQCDDVPIHRAMHAPHIELRPAGRGQVVLHSRELDGGLASHHEFPPTMTRDVFARAIDVVPALAESVVADVRPASRPIPADGFPSVGGLDDVPGYYEAISHSGITLAAVIGQLLAEEIVDGEINPLIRPYRPGRLTAAEPVT